MLPAHLILKLARRHATANQSAAICLSDAEGCWSRWDFEATRRRALDSLRYSVGIFHRDYRRAVHWGS